MAHRTTIKVRGYHLDFYGHVNNARYLEFLEEARWRLVESSASLREWKHRGLAFLVVKIVVNYRRPAVLDDELIIVTDVPRLGGRSGIIRQVVSRVRDGVEEPVIDADVTFVVADVATGKAVAMEGEIRAALESRE